MFEERAPAQDFWSAEQDAELRRSWGAIDTKLIGEAVGRSVDAVAGRARRLELPALGVKSSPARRGAARPKVHGFHLAGHVHVRAPRINPAARPLPVNPRDVGKVSLVDRTDGQCAWPCDIGLAFCGDPKPDTPGVPYCDRHTSRAHQPATGHLSDAALIHGLRTLTRIPLARFSRR